MMITGKYCTYCRKADHNDSECWCTRVGPSVPFERYVLPEPTNSAIGPAPVAAEVASIDTRPLPRSSFKYGTQDMYHGHVVRKWGQQAVADALAGQDEGLMQCVAERDHARECLLAEKQRAENAEAGREQWQKNSNFWQTLASEREAALAQVAGGQVAVEDQPVFGCISKTLMKRLLNMQIGLSENLPGDSFSYGMPAPTYEQQDHLTKADFDKIVAALTAAPATPQPAPVAGPCKGCNGQGLVGNILDTDTCPFCKGTGTDIAAIIPQSP